LNIRSTDVGRSIADLHHRINIEDFPGLLKESIEHGRDVEKEVRSRHPTRSRIGCSSLRIPQFASTLLIALTGYDTPEAHAL
jgi:hypothetical protein